MADIIVFGEDWNKHPSSTQHLIKHLLPSHRIIWINSIGMRQPKFCINDTKRLFQKFKELISSTKHTQKHHHNLTVINLKIIPFHNNKIIRTINKLYMIKTLKNLCLQYRIKNPILWLSLPTAVDIIGHLNEMASIYYCGDDFSELSGVDHKMIAPMEAELANKANIIMIASRALQKKFPYDKTVLLPHGVDFHLFSQPINKIKKIESTHKTAGFYGSISDWLDIDMIIQTMQAMPNWKFIFIGDVKTDISQLKKYGNFTLIEAQKHSQLPNHIQNWDVALLPFKLNGQIKACNPLKLREYLASGIPIASINFPAVHQYKNLISIQQTGEQFKDVIERAFEQRHEKKLRQDAVINESWQKRSEDISSLFDYFKKNVLTNTRLNIHTKKGL